MIPQSLEDRIRELAHEKWKSRMAAEQHLIFEKGELREITEQDDWLEAEDEIIREAKKTWE